MLISKNEDKSSEDGVWRGKNKNKNGRRRSSLILWNASVNV